MEARQTSVGRIFMTEAMFSKSSLIAGIKSSAHGQYKKWSEAYSS